MICRLPALKVTRVRVLGADQKKSGLWGLDCQNASEYTHARAYARILCANRSLTVKKCIYKCYEVFVDVVVVDLRTLDTVIEMTTFVGFLVNAGGRCLLLLN